MNDLISRQAAIDAIMCEPTDAHYPSWYAERLEQLPSAQSEIIRCKDCKYGEQDEVGRWFCNDLGCQMGSEDGSGYCAAAERRTG